MTQSVFISYSQKDLAVAQAVCAALEQAGISCWIAPRDIPTGQDWPAAIAEAIRGAKCFVLVFSASSNASEEVPREVQLAVENKAPILPFRIEDFQLSPKLQYYLTSVQWLKAFPPPAEQYLPQLIQTVQQTLSLPAAAPAPPINTAAPLPAPLPFAIPPAPKNNLPFHLTSFIGREPEIEQVQALLCQHCLVTLTGVGGTGKTRLSLQVAAGMLDAFPDGVRLVELAPIADPALVPQAVITALGQVEQPGMTPIAFLQDYLRPKHLLLILDNCEHLVEACAALAAALMQNAPYLTILASSREILGVAGETPFRVPPLGMPDPHRQQSLEEILQFDAVRLFIERGRVVSPNFTLTSENAPAVAQITQRLDGIPLAIELAAARLRLLSVAQISARLNDVFRLLTGGARTALPRHQTLQALIDWSYNLLSEAERKLLRSLSVFAGGWTFEAAEEVCAENFDILDLLGQLADKSLILVGETPGGEMRYRMLETIRQYAHSMLVAAGEAELVRQRHLAFYLHLAETLEPRLRSRDQVQLLDYLETELDNLRMALEWALQTGIEAELRLAASLQWFWQIRYHWAEGMAWLEQGLAAEALLRGNLPPAGTRAAVRAKALTSYGFHLLHLSNFGPKKARVPLEESLLLYRSSSPQNSQGLGWTLVQLSECSHMDGDLTLALAQAQEALSLFRECAHPDGIAESLQAIGDCEIDPVQQLKTYQQRLAINETMGDIDGIATALVFIGLAELTNSNYSGAYICFEKSKEHFRRVGNPDMVATSGVLLAITSLFNGELEKGSQVLELAFAGFREMAYHDMFAYCIYWKGLIAFSQGRYDQVAALIEEASQFVLRTAGNGIYTHILCLSARLARLRGDAKAARQSAERVANAAGGLIPVLLPSRMLALLELGHLAEQESDLTQARLFFYDAFQHVYRRGDRPWTGFPLDGLAGLAVRQDKMERAARLFGTRLWRGFAHTLSPIEHAERDADFSAIAAALGAQRFAQLRDEGFAMPFMQVMSLAQAED